MNREKGIQIVLSVEAIEEYCQTMTRTISSVEKRLVSLDALKTFIAAMTDIGEQAKPDYIVIKSTLDKYFEQFRHELHEKQLEILAAALKGQRLTRVVAVYNAISRDAFWKLLQDVENGMSQEAYRQIRQWCSDWLQEVKRCSSEVSPFPDAIDFKAVGIEVDEFTAMCDIDKYFRQA